MSPPPRIALALLLLVLTLASGCSGKQTAGGGGAPALEAELGSLPPNSGPAATLRRSRILRALGRHDQALTELSQAAEGARERLDWAALAALWREVGDVNLEQGHPQEALEAFGKRLKTAAALEKQVERARALVDTGYAFILMGSMSRADEATSEAELLVGEEELVADPATAERLALTLQLLAKPDRPAQLLGRAQQGYDALGDATGAARAAVYRAALQARQEGGAAALDALDPIVARSADPDPKLRLLRFKAEAALEDRQYARCEKLATEAVELADKRGIQPVAKLGRVVLARCAAEAGHLDVAIRRAEEAGFLAEDQRQHLTGDAARQAAGFEAFLIYRLLLSLQVKLPERQRAAAAFVTMERARARAHLDALIRSRASTQGVGEASPLLLRNKEEAEAQLRDLMRDLTEHRKDPILAERHKNALWALEDIKEALAQQNPLLSRIDIPQPPTAAQVRETMLAREGDALLVSYFVGEDQVVAIALDKTSEKLVVLKSSPEKLTKTLRAFRREVLLESGRAMPDVKAAGARLYEELLGPLDALVKSHRSLIVIPHGELGSIPFETLVDSQGKFLVEGHDVSYSLSATLGVELAKAAAPSASRKGFVGLGDPVYDWASFKASRPEGAAAASRGLSLWIDAASLSSAGEAPRPAQQGLARLPGTGAELKAIAKLFGADQHLYLREQATEENVKAGVLAGHRIVHIASHGLLEPHYQALALTLNPESKEDGFLLHSEIVDLKLDADLVVLSACQTGNTRLRSSAEPVAGLALALRRAGARRVVVSLWSVDDEATARLMTDFYRPLVKEGAGYGASLSEAKRKMLAHGPSHPYFWAPFVLLGN